MVGRSQGIATIGDPDEATLGPAMLACTLAQRRFVLGKLHGLSAKAAAKEAGYRDNPGNSNQIEVAASKLTHDPKVMAAISEMARGLGIVEGIPTAIRAFIDVASDPTKEAKDRNTAAKELCDRFGFAATSKHEMNVTHVDLTSDEAVKKLERLSKVFKFDPQKVVDSVTIDAEFEEVKAVPEEPGDETTIEGIL
jgi:phage terminase small subunit